MGIGEVFESCGLFAECSCNVCPLDPASVLHGGPRVALDGEERCRSRRSAREAVAVAAGYPPTWARLPREVNRDKRRAAWLALPEEERARREGVLRARLAKLNPDSGGSVAGDRAPEGQDTGDHP